MQPGDIATLFGRRRCFGSAGAVVCTDDKRSAEIMSKTISLVTGGEVLRDGLAQLGAGSAVYLADGETVGLTVTAEADIGSASASNGEAVTVSGKKANLALTGVSAPFDTVLTLAVGTETTKHRVTVLPRYGADTIVDYGVC